MSEIDSQSLANLDASARKEIMEWIESENSKAKVQTSIHNFTDMCFKKCITKINSGSLDRNEESCLTNCLNRFLDTNINIVKMIQQTSSQ
ncbi:uncharacterized protein SAPINGB_P002219 [Magnusiomyces paraingens]|uniref:Mitochondrial import inner membrane translocase subunit n=1 Tax=Magnusiomyces paraingens TaxID=2606893 RepID=A0A5E8BE59_9ASCO|nr:uncharacterized protein SAPINGB_P002219 [Saprochaete ingens]VVT49334.1 unnamed protein product [Saprochaete ingens]